MKKKKVVFKEYVQNRPVMFPPSLGDERDRRSPRAEVANCPDEERKKNLKKTPGKSISTFADPRKKQ